MYVKDNSRPLVIAHQVKLRTSGNILPDVELITVSTMDTLFTGDSDEDALTLASISVEDILYPSNDDGVTYGILFETCHMSDDVHLNTVLFVLREKGELSTGLTLCDADGCTILHNAAGFGSHMHLTTILRYAHFDDLATTALFAQDNKGRTPLHLVCAVFAGTEPIAIFPDSDATEDVLGESLIKCIIYIFEVAKANNVLSSLLSYRDNAGSTALEYVPLDHPVHDLVPAFM